MNIFKMIEEIKNTLEYQRILLDKEIDRHNARVDVEDYIDVYQVRNAMNNYNDVEELKAIIEEIKNR